MMDADEREYELRLEVADAMLKDVEDVTSDDIGDYLVDSLTRQTANGYWRQ